MTPPPDAALESLRVVRPREAARLLGVSVTSLWRMRRRLGLPEPITLSPGAIGWRIETLRAWLAAREREGGR